MKIYAIWKYKDSVNKTIDSVYSDPFVEGEMNGLKEYQLISKRQKSTSEESYCNSKLTLKEFSTYNALSFHGNLPSISGCCLLIGDLEFQSLTDKQKFFLIKNILKDNRVLADIIRTPQKYITTCVFSTKLSEEAVQANKNYISHHYDVNKIINSSSELKYGQKSKTTFFSEQSAIKTDLKDEEDRQDREDARKARAQLMSDNVFQKILRGCCF